MNKTFRFITASAITALFLVLVLGSVTPAYSQGRGAPGRGRQLNPEERVSALQEQLVLSDQQVEALLPIFQRQGDTIQGLMEQFQDQERSRETMKTLRSEMGKVREETKESLSSVLTVEQMSEFQKFGNENRPRRGQGRERGRF